MKRTIAVVTVLFALTLMALAHGKEKHVMGTVTSISDSSVTVETTAKKSVTVQVSDKTKFEKSGAAATLKDLKVGDKVAIHADVPALGYHWLTWFYDPIVRLTTR